MRRWILLAFCLLLTSSEAGYYRMKPQAGTYKNPRGGMAVGIYGSAPYSLVDGMYGNAAGTGNGNSSCTGEISTDFEWIPDTIPGTTRPNLADEPPEELILREAIDIGARVISVNTEAYVEVNHGLAGFPLPNGSPGPSIPYVHDDLPWFAGGTVIGVIRQTFAKGIRYRIIPGAKNITITCDPSALSFETLGSGDTYVRYMASIIVPKVDVLGSQLAATDTDWLLPHYAAGQTVECTVSLSQRPEDSGIDVKVPINDGDNSTTLRWRINDVTSNYRESRFSPTEGRFIALEADSLRNDFNNEKFRFFSVKNGDPNLRVEFALKLAPVAPGGYELQNLVIDLNQSDPRGSQLNLIRRMRCVRPVFVSWQVEDGTINPTTGPLGQPGVMFGSASKPGQNWLNASCAFENSSLGIEGQTSFLQLITATRQCTLTGQFSQVIFRNEQYNAEASDTTVPYMFGGTVDLDKLNAGSDRPSQFLYPENEINVSMQTIVTGNATASDKFRTYFLYRPKTKAQSLPVHWISIAKYTWSWTGSVTYDSTSGNVAITGQGEHAAPSASPENPVWSRNLPYNFLFRWIR